MANVARNEETYVYAIGRGSELVTSRGQNVFKCMANINDSLKRCYNPKQPVGV
jgi:hypothetical protein